MKKEESNVINAARNTSLADCKAVAGASELCSCKDVCLRGTSETDAD
jgi:hypothetical protein